MLFFKDEQGSVLFYHCLLQLADKQRCAPLMEINWKWWDRVLLSKPKKSDLLLLHCGVWSSCRLSVCQSVGNKALWGHWGISRVSLPHGDIGGEGLLLWRQAQSVLNTRDLRRRVFDELVWVLESPRPCSRGAASCHKSTSGAAGVW